MRIHYQWPCPFCNKILESRNQFINHKRKEHPGLIYNPGGNCKFCNKSFKFINHLTAHENHCLQNPKRIKYKCSHPMTIEMRQKISNTAKLHKLSGGYRKGSGHGKKGWYKGYFCDSSWELAFVIYNIDHGIKFERNKKIFNYTFNGEECHYLPDFIVDGKYVEIKGYWNEQWQAKLDQFPKEEKIEVITTNEIKLYLDYVIEKYGINFTDLYEGKTYIKKEKKIKHDWKCKYCNEIFDSRQKLYEHLKLCEEKIKLKIIKKIEKRNIRIKEYKLNDILLDSLGRPSHNKYKEEIWIERKEKIINCGVNLMKFGWVEKVIKNTGYTKRIIADTLEHFKDEFEGKYFRRKLPAK